MAWGGLTHNQQSSLLNPIFLELVPNPSDRNRILNAINTELTGNDINENPQNQNGTNSGC